MRIAKTAALLLAMAPSFAIAQRSGRGLDRKPSPATSATSAPSGQSGAASAAVTAPATRQSAPPQNFPRPNINTTIAPVHVQPAASQPVMRPVTAVQPSPDGIAGGCAFGCKFFCRGCFSAGNNGPCTNARTNRNSSLCARTVDCNFSECIFGNSLENYLRENRRDNRRSSGIAE